jgi:hypothetical protein
MLDFQVLFSYFHLGPYSEVEFLHPKDGVYSEKSNKVGLPPHCTRHLVFCFATSFAPSFSTLAARVLRVHQRASVVMFSSFRFTVGCLTMATCILRFGNLYLTVARGTLFNSLDSSYVTCHRVTTSSLDASISCGGCRAVAWCVSVRAPRAMS